MRKALLSTIAFMAICQINPFIQMSRAHNDVTSNDSSKTLYEQRKQRSIERFGPRCQVAENGLPKYCDDMNALNRQLLARNDTAKAWQFIKINKKVLGIEKPESEVRLKPLDYYEIQKDTSSYLLYFQEMVKDFEVGGYGYKIAFDKQGKIKYLEGKFLPEAKHFDVSGCISKKEAIKIALGDTAIFNSDYMEEYRELGDKIIWNFRKAIFWSDNNYRIIYQIQIMADVIYHISINAKTREITFRGYEI